MAARPPRVAVLLSTYNGARFLEEQLDSLLAQRGVEVHLHARDDGSTDQTLEILARYAAHWPGLAGLAAGPNMGPAASFLELLRTAPDDMDYYAFCDQDDVWLPEKLARATAALANDEGPALYCSNVLCVLESLEPIGPARTSTRTDLHSLLYENSVYGCTTVMNPAARREIIRERPQQDITMHDWWSALIVAAQGVIHYDHEPQILYRQHGANSVGAALTYADQLGPHVRKFLRSVKNFYPIQAQAAELLRLHGRRMDEAQAQIVGELADSKASTLARLRLAASERVVRTRPLDRMAARILIAMNWH